MVHPVYSHSLIKEQIEDQPAHMGLTTMVYDSVFSAYTFYTTFLDE